MYQFIAVIENKQEAYDQLQFYVWATGTNDAWSKAKQLKEDLYGAYFVKSVKHQIYEAI